MKKCENTVAALTWARAFPVFARAPPKFLCKVIHCFIKCHILNLKCTKIDLFFGFVQDALRELTALPRPCSWI